MTSQGSRIFLDPVLLVDQPHLKSTKASSLSFQKWEIAHVMLSQEMVSQAEWRGQRLVAKLAEVISTFVHLTSFFMNSFHLLFQREIPLLLHLLLLGVEDHQVEVHQLGRML